MNVHKGWAFPRGIYSEVHSPITTPEIICVMALTLQPIRGCPQHSGETGTRLSSAIHRRLLSRFFLTEGGDFCTQAKSKADSPQPSTNNHSYCMSRTTKPQYLRNKVLFAVKNIRIKLFLTLLQKYIKFLRNLISLKQ